MQNCVREVAYVKKSICVIYDNNKKMCIFMQEISKTIIECDTNVIYTFVNINNKLERIIYDNNGYVVQYYTHLPIENINIQTKNRIIFLYTFNI